MAACTVLPLHASLSVYLPAGKWTWADASRLPRAFREFAEEQRTPRINRKRIPMSKNYRAEVDAALQDVDFEKNTYLIEFDTTLGTVLLDLWTDVAPGHCRNIIGLTKVGFYDGIIAHRIIEGFVVQIGCPHGTGTGGPGYTIPAEFNDKPHEAGVLSMARTSDPNSAGSQFFICLGRVPHLDKQYTAFGKTANQESLDIILKMGGVATDAQDKPREEIKITGSRLLVQPK